MSIPSNCTHCEYENCCDSARNMSGCHFYGMAEPSFIEQVKKLLRRLFK